MAECKHMGCASGWMSSSGGTRSMIKKTRRVYKVVRVLKNGQRVSAIIDGEARTTYHPDKWVEGCEGTPLIAFRFQRQANAYRYVAANFQRNWKDPRRQVEVWVADATNVRSASRTMPERLVNMVASCKTVMLFWKKDKHSRAATTRAWPEGTYLCDAIRLQKRIS